MKGCVAAGDGADGVGVRRGRGGRRTARSAGAPPRTRTAASISTVLVVGLGTALASIPAPVLSQGTEAPVRTHRHLAVGNVAFVPTWEPTVQGGYLYQLSVARSDVSVDDLGVTTVTPPRWYLHSLVSAGWAGDTDGVGGDGASVTGQAGLLYRFDGPMTISRAGLAVQRSWRPSGWAPVARVGFFHGNAALSAGWIFFDGVPADGVVVGVDLLRCILQDLGLVSGCVVP